MQVGAKHSTTDLEYTDNMESLAGVYEQLQQILEVKILDQISAATAIFSSFTLHFKVGEHHSAVFIYYAILFIFYKYIHQRFNEISD